MPKRQVSAAEPIRAVNLRVEEAAKLIGIGRSFAYELIADGQMQALKIGRLTRIRREEAERVARELPTAGRAA